MIEIAKSMGLTVIKPARLKADETELQDEHKMASLRLPLVKYDQMIERRKRKKMRWIQYQEKCLLMKLVDQNMSTFLVVHMFVN